MPEYSASPILIDENQLAKYTEKSNILLAKVKWTPKADLAYKVQTGASSEWRDAAIEPAAPEELSIVRIGRKLSKDPLFLTEPINHTLLTLRQGLRLGMYLSALYTHASGLDTLLNLNLKGGLSDAQKTEFRDKHRTASAISLFVAAYFVAWELTGYMEDEIANADPDFHGVPELHLTDPLRATECMVFYYGAYLERTGTVHTEADMIRMTQRYFQGMVDAVKEREASLKYVDAFTSRTYKLASGNFFVNGFTTSAGDRVASVAFNRVEMGEILGNREAKHKARRLAERLLCYDPETRRNPIRDMGGLPTLRIGYGEPGTGKSLQIAATATLISDYCKEIGIPFLFWPMPDNLLSTYQGGSAERTLAWMKPLRDPTRIVYAPVDDAENNLEDRVREGAPTGVREIVAVFLRNTERAYGVNHGNAVLDLYTAFPDQLDRALLSRISDRFHVGGATDWRDFLDQDYLWWRKFAEMVPGFVNMADPPDYAYLGHQRMAENSESGEAPADEPTDERMRSIFQKVREAYPVTDHIFFARLFVAVKDEFPLFTSQDVRNIQNAVNERIMDFDFPAEWRDDPNRFFRRDYAAKKAMLTELMKKRMAGMSFAEIRLRETVRYLDGMARIQMAETERRIEEAVNEMLLRERATQRVSELKWRY